MALGILYINIPIYAIFYLLKGAISLEVASLLPCKKNCMIFSVSGGELTCNTDGYERHLVVPKRQDQTVQLRLELYIGVRLEDSRVMVMKG